MNPAHVVIISASLAAAAIFSFVSLVMDFGAIAAVASALVGAASGYSVSRILLAARTAASNPNQRADCLGNPSSLGRTTLRLGIDSRIVVSRFSAHFSTCRCFSDWPVSLSYCSRRLVSSPLQGFALRKRRV